MPFSRSQSTWFIAMGLCFVSQMAIAKETQPPLVGRPADFSGLIGKHSLIVEVQPKEVFVGEPVMLKLTITAEKSGRPVTRKNLNKILPESIYEDFLVEPLPEKDRHEDGKRWEFFYHLRPKSPQTNALPLMWIVYWDPTRSQFPEADQFRTTLQSPLESIELKVKIPPKVIVAPQRMYEFSGIADVAVDPLDSRPPWWAWLLGLGVPPILSVTWLSLWWYTHPDEIRRARQRWSRAARQTLKALKRIKDDRNGEQTARLLNHYLLQRLDMSGRERTPEEYRPLLLHAGLTESDVKTTLDLLQACQQFRFMPPDVPRVRDLSDEAQQCIQQLESKEWGIV